jgi:hypothetical protein
MPPTVSTIYADIVSQSAAYVMGQRYHLGTMLGKKNALRREAVEEIGSGRAAKDPDREGDLKLYRETGCPGLAPWLPPGSGCGRRACHRYWTYGA